jgi:hypothetical protein
VGRSGFPLEQTGDDTFTDPRTGDEFVQDGETLTLTKEAT